jgi:hypothetical protein
MADPHVLTALIQKYTELLTLLKPKISYLHPGLIRQSYK